MSLNLTSREQSALADLCALAKAIQYRHLTVGEYSTDKQNEELNEIIERFDCVRWDVLYDKLHRTGANF